MKISKSLFLAFAGLGLFACSNEDVTTGVDNSGNNSIVIKLDGLSDGSRSVGDPTTGDDNTTVLTTMSDVAILLSDGTKILGHTTIDANSQSTEWGQLKGSGYIMHEVNSHVREVHVIGNYTKHTGLKNIVDNIADDGTTDLSNVTTQVIKAASQQTFGEVTLYGVDNALTTVTGGDEGDADNHEGTTHTMLQADVTVNHLVSRIEIGNIQCTDLNDGADAMYDKITLKYIGLLNYYNQTTIGGTVSTPMTLANVLEPTDANKTPGEGMYSWSATSSNADYNWAWDPIDNSADAAVLDSKDEVYNPSTNKKFVYQFIPSQVKESGLKNFNVKLYLDAQEKGTNNINAFHTVTANFTGDTDFTYEPGKIYKVDLAFGEENIGPWNPDEVICVRVKVTVADWTIKALTPTFE